jgi:16S rRNA processing protein RimM
LTLVTAGRIGKAHGRDGSFYVDEPRTEFAEGDEVQLLGEPRRIVRRAGTDDRPLIKLEGIDDPAAMRGELMLVEDELEEGEYLAADLIGCEVPGLGRVRRVLDAPSCPLLEVGDEGRLVPLIGDAVKRIDLEAKIIEVDRDFLGY